MGQGRHTLRSISDPVYPPFESTARSYFRVTESQEASSRLTQTVMDTNH